MLKGYSPQLYCTKVRMLIVPLSLPLFQRQYTNTQNIVNPIDKFLPTPGIEPGYSAFRADTLYLMNYPDKEPVHGTSFNTPFTCQGQE